MANHIENYILIENSNEEVLKEVQRVFQTEEGQWEADTEELAQRVFGEDTPEEYDRGWYSDTCGAKWMHGSIDDDSVEEQTVRITSAWDPVNGWVERFAENLRKIKSDVVVHNTFEDEGYNFAGVYFVAEHYDDCEWIDMDEYDVNKIWEDDDVRECFYDELHSLLTAHKECYVEILEDVKNNPEHYD